MYTNEDKENQIIIYNIINNLIYGSNEIEVFERSEKLMEIMNKIIIENRDFIHEVSGKKIKSFYDIVEFIENNEYENYTQIINDIETIRYAFKESFIGSPEKKLSDSFLQFINIKINEEINKKTKERVETIEKPRKNTNIDMLFNKIENEIKSNTIFYNILKDIEKEESLLYKNYISKTVIPEPPKAPNTTPLPVPLSWKKWCEYSRF